MGCALPVDRLPELRSRLEAYARQRLVPEDFVPVLEYDGEVLLDDVNRHFWKSLVRLEPFGSGNPTPVFVVRGVKLVQPPRILKEKHLKLRVVPGAVSGMANSNVPRKSWAGAWPSGLRQSRCFWEMRSTSPSPLTTTHILTSAGFN